jgi:hypothetical protein
MVICVRAVLIRRGERNDHLHIVLWPVHLVGLGEVQGLVELMATWFVYLIIAEFTIAGVLFLFKGQWMLAGYALSAALVNLFVIGGMR